MRLGLSSAAFYGRREVEDTAALLPGYGLDVCEVFLNSFSEYSTDFGGLVRERLNGLPCVSVHPKGTQFEPDIFRRLASGRTRWTSSAGSATRDRRWAQAITCSTAWA